MKRTTLARLFVASLLLTGLAIMLGTPAGASSTDSARRLQDILSTVGVLNSAGTGIGAKSRFGTATFTVCGDADTVATNTVYYGPSQVLASSATVGMRTCDTTAAGSATEATADTPAFTGTAFGVAAMECTSDNPGVAGGLTFALRNNAAATVPSVTCNVANGAAGTCIANIQTTTDVASGNPISVAVTAGAAVGTVHFRCDVTVVF